DCKPLPLSSSPSIRPPAGRRRSRAGRTTVRKATFARIAQNSIAVGSREERRLGAAAKELGIWLVTGVNEVDAERPRTNYTALLYHSPQGELALHHRKLVPTNHERLIWGQGDGRGLHAVETGFGRVGGRIRWE